MEKCLVQYRDIRKPENDVKDCLAFYESKIGDSIIFNDFLSCHTDDIRISDEEDEFQFVITTKDNSNARDIQEITFVNNEKEVLFKSGTKFLVEEVDKKENRVYVREI